MNVAYQLYVTPTTHAYEQSSMNNAVLVLWHADVHPGAV